LRTTTAVTNCSYYSYPVTLRILLLLRMVMTMFLLLLTKKLRTPPSLEPGKMPPPKTVKTKRKMTMTMTMRKDAPLMENHGSHDE